MYRQTIEYYCAPFRVNTGMLEGTVVMEGFGLIISQSVYEESYCSNEAFDCGVLSARSYEMNALISKLATLVQPDKDSIAAAIIESQELWEQNEHGNSFVRTARAKLRARYRQNPNILKHVPIFNPAEELTSRLHQLLDRF